MANPKRAAQTTSGLLNMARARGIPRERLAPIAKWISETDPALAKKFMDGDITPEVFDKLVKDHWVSRASPSAQQADRLNAKQKDLPFDDAEDPQGLLTHSPIGPGVMVDGPSGPGVVTGIGGPGVLNHPVSRNVRPNQPIANRGPRDLTNPAPGRVIDAEFEPVSRDLIPSQRGLATSGQGPRKPGSNWPYYVGAGLGLGGAGLGIDLMFPPGKKSDSEAGGLTSTGGAADLHAEQSPPPEVSAPPEPTAETYFNQARALIDRLNQMRRNAGGEVPEAQQIMAQVQKLQAMGNKMRNAPNYKPSDSGDPHQQAQMLIQQLNQMRQKAGGEVPQAAQIMAEVRRLQAMGDQQRNSRYSRSGDSARAYPRSA